MNLRIARIWAFLMSIPLSEMVVRLLLVSACAVMTAWFLVNPGLPSSLYVFAWLIAMAGTVGVAMELVLAALDDGSEGPTDDDTDDTDGPSWELRA